MCCVVRKNVFHATMSPRCHLLKEIEQRRDPKCHHDPKSPLTPTPEKNNVQESKAKSRAKPMKAKPS
jgi:hypothetical protein